jgi:hypothetical protein
MILESFGFAGSCSTPQMGVYLARSAPTSARPPPEKREAIVGDKADTFNRDF